MIGCCVRKVLPLVSAILPILIALLVTPAFGTEFSVLHEFGTYGPSSYSISGEYVFGTTYTGGNNDEGTLWSYDLNNGAFTELHHFGPVDDIEYPFSSLVHEGNVFGTASVRDSGINGEDPIWVYDLASDELSIAHEFSHGDGISANVGLVRAGKLFGTSGFGGASYLGALWSYDLSSGDAEVLHYFTGGGGELPSPNMLLSDNKLFGTTNFGGVNLGVFWSYDLDSDRFRVLRYFGSDHGGMANTETNGTIYGTQGGHPYGPDSLWAYHIESDSFQELRQFDDFEQIGRIQASGSTIYGLAARESRRQFDTLWAYDIATNDFKAIYELDTETYGFSQDLKIDGNRLFGISRGGTYRNAALWSIVIPEPPSAVLSAFCLCAVVVENLYRQTLCRGLVRPK